MAERKIILIDMDGVISDIEKGFRKAWSEKYSKIPCPLPQNRKTHSLKGNFNRKYFNDIDSIIYSKGFIKNLPPIDGAIKALEEIAQKYEIFICSTPLQEYKNCILEKYAWIEKQLGNEWIKKIILTRDKTIVKGDILIDDNPYADCDGLEKPEWEHIIYDQPYNKHIINKKRISWNNWKEVLKI